MERADRKICPFCFFAQIKVIGQKITNNYRNYKNRFKYDDFYDGAYCRIPFSV